VAGSRAVMGAKRGVDGRPRIRRMRKRDLAAVVRLEEGIYPQPWSSTVFAEELSLLNRHYVVIEDDKRIVGYGGLLLVAEDAHVTTLAIDPTARRRRHGTRLMLALVDAALAAGAKHLTLEVRVSNAGARALYQRFGFAPVGVRKDYYRDEDALVMWATDIDDPAYGERLAAIRADIEEMS
jgi:ribosomal-protein-alanine N-acetyltransferase